MDTLSRNPAEAALLKATLGLHWTILKKPASRQTKPVDALLELRHAGRTLKYIAEIRRRLRPATFGSVIHQAVAQGDQALLVSGHITPPLADQLRTKGVQFIDAAGNAFLNAPPLLIWVKGEKPAGQLTPPMGGRLHTNVAAEAYTGSLSGASIGLVEHHRSKNVWIHVGR